MLFSQQDFMEELLRNRLENLPLTIEMTAPAYDGGCIANLPASICDWLGVDFPGIKPLDKRITSAVGREFKHVILTVVDGLGWEQFQRFAGMDTHESRTWNEILQDSLLTPLTSVAPSTTASALTSFWTGLPPAGHGITGYEMWLQEYGITANMIHQSPSAFLTVTGGLAAAGFNPDKFLGVPTLGPVMRSQGVYPVALQHNSIHKSGLSQMLLAGVNALPFRTLSDLWWTLEQAQSDRSDQKKYFYLYWGELDELQHVYGPEDPRVAQEYFVFLRAMLRFLQRARSHGKGDTLFLLTADHGQVSSVPEPSADIRRHPEFLQMLHLLPTGESRMPYLYLKPGFEARVLAMMEELYPGQFIAVDSEEALEAGLFGAEPYHAQIRSRIGDKVLLARENYYLFWPDKENLLLGRHGGLNRKEMIVPLAAVVI